MRRSLSPCCCTNTTLSRLDSVGSSHTIVLLLQRQCAALSCCCQHLVRYKRAAVDTLLSYLGKQLVHYGLVTVFALHKHRLAAAKSSCAAAMLMWTKCTVMFCCCHHPARCHLAVVITKRIVILTMHALVFGISLLHVLMKCAQVLFLLSTRDSTQVLMVAQVFYERRTRDLTRDLINAQV